MNLLPRPDLCFITPDPRPEKEGSLFLPPNRAHTGLPNIGVVRFLNPKTTADFKVGDRVLYNRHGQFLWTLGGELVSQVKVSDVMAIL